MTFTITKTDEDRQMIFGWANVSLDESGQEVVDLHGDSIPDRELEKAVYNYMEKHQLVGKDHREFKLKGKIVESLYLNEEKAKAMNIDITKAYKGAWWIGMKILDKDLWSSVKKGGHLAFSIGGKADTVA